MIPSKAQGSYQLSAGRGGGEQNPSIPCNSAIWKLITIKFGSVRLHFKVCSTTWKVLMTSSLWRIYDIIFVFTDVSVENQNVSHFPEI